MIELQIEKYILEKLEEPEFSDYYLLGVKYNPASKKVEVFVDSDAGISLGVTSKLNRYLQTQIDEADLLGEQYILDVSSPGITTPLKLVRQYRKNLGRILEVTYKVEGRNVRQKGTLTKVDDEKGIVIQYEVKEKIGKKNVVNIIEKELAFDEIEKAVVKVSFK
ncbi:MAG: ribosome maturation factor RimP [Maribacter sp.]|jgi:ribosome maturation factor RimP